MNNSPEIVAQFINEIENNQFEVNSQNQEEIEIKEIPKSIFHKDNTARFSGADWFNEVSKQVISICGCGGIGSWTAGLLSRLNPKAMFLYDPDNVEIVNMAGQFYTKDVIGNNKACSLSSLVIRFSNYFNASSSTHRVNRYSILSDVVICGFDNMKARKEAFMAWENIVYRNNNKSECLFIDGRLDAETFQVFCIRGDNEANKNIYRERYLFSDEEGESTVCSYKQTSFCASMIASVITNLFVNFCSNKANGDFRVLPFLTTYDATTMQLKQE